MQHFLHTGKGQYSWHGLVLVCERQVVCISWQMTHLDFDFFESTNSPTFDISSLDDQFSLSELTDILHPA